MIWDDNMEHEQIKIPTLWINRNIRNYTKYKDDNFMQNLERLLMVCMLKDYVKTIDGIRYRYIMDDMVLWIHDNDRNQEMFLSRLRTDDDWFIDDIVANITDSEVRNMAWLVEYIIINDYDIRKVGIDEIYELWKTGIPEIFGDIDDRTLNQIKNSVNC